MFGFTKKLPRTGYLVSFDFTSKKGVVSTSQGNFIINDRALFDGIIPTKHQLLKLIFIGETVSQVVLV